MAFRIVMRSIFIAGALSSGIPTFASEAPVDPKIKKAIDQAPGVVKKAMEKFQESQERADRKRKAAIVSDNTLLASTEIHEVPVGIYKRDVKEAAFVAAEIGIDFLFAQYMLRHRKKLILNGLKTDYHELLHILDVSKETSDAWRDAFIAKKPIEKVRSNGLELVALYNVPLSNYLKQHHRTFGVLPISTGTVLPLLGRWLLIKVMDSIKAKALKVPYTELYFHPVYEKNKEGELVRAKNTPFSIITRVMGFAKFLYAPFAELANLFPSTVDLTKKLLISSKVPVPSFLFGDTVKYGAEFVSICFGAKMFDAIYAARWEAYVLKKRHVLKELLLAYDKAVTAGNIRELAEADKELRKFVENGHRMKKALLPGNMLGNWWSGMRSGKLIMPKWITAAITGVIAIRTILFVRSLVQSSKKVS